LSSAVHKDSDSLIQRQSAEVLLSAAVAFLTASNVPPKLIRILINDLLERPRRIRARRNYKKIIWQFDEIGLLLATWFSNPSFLDSSGNPFPLSSGKGVLSLANLILQSGARITPYAALALLKQSTSVKIDVDGKLHALRRVFVATNYDLPRAAFTLDCLLNTLEQNARHRKGGGIQLLERISLVKNINIDRLAPSLRNINEHGTAFMDAVDGELVS